MIISLSVFGQIEGGKMLEISSKTGGVLKHHELRPDTMTRYRTGILVLESVEGLVYRSNLRAYPEITIELRSPEGELVFQLKNEMKRNTNYNLSVDHLPAGNYLLHFMTEDRLIVCNVRLAG